MVHCYVQISPLLAVVLKRLHSVHTVTRHFLKFNFNIILLSFVIKLFLSGTLTKILKDFLDSPMRALLAANRILLNFISIIIML
jgi:flagellar biosynthesis protein FlhB